MHTCVFVCVCVCVYVCMHTNMHLDTDANMPTLQGALNMRAASLGRKVPGAVWMWSLVWDLTGLAF